jgi:hypothetical protein
VKFPGKSLQSVSLLVLLLSVAGCQGINLGRSFSPIDFLLPGVGGFLKADPSPTHPDPKEPNLPKESVVLVAKL